jgi:hypothetical protein
MLQIALIALLAQTAVAQQPSTGAIQGVVVRAGTAEALSKAIVEMRGDAESAPPVYRTTTESDGRFVFRGVRPGRYRLMVTRSGYVHRALSVTVDDVKPQDVPVVLTPTGAISGRIYGSSGQPLGNVDVAALRATYQNGKRTLTPVQSVRTDDRGEYRLFWLAPGRYYVSATHPDALSRMFSIMGLSVEGSFEGGGSRGPLGLQMVRGTGDPALASSFGPSSLLAPKEERYVPVYFPGTIDEQGAAVIELQSGADLGGVDIALAPVRAHHVRGTVINGTTGQVAQYAGLTVTGGNSFPDGPNGLLEGSTDGRGRPLIESDGSFDLALFPGPHTLIGTAGTGVGYVSLEMRDADIDGVQVVAMPAFNVPGRLVTDGQVDRSALANVRLSLRRDLPVPATRSSSYSLLRPDGSFVVEATPGDYRVNVSPILDLPGQQLPPSLRGAVKGLERVYVKSIRLADVDVLNGGVRLERPPSSPLEIVIGTNPGELDGSVSNATQAAAAGVSVVVLPDVRGRIDLFKTTTTDPAGRFHIDRMPPGDYKAFAWEDVNDGAWQDPEFMSANENLGTPIRIAEGTTGTVRLTVIPRQ